MAESSQEQLGVATVSGGRWETENFLLYQSTDPTCIFYINKYPQLGREAASGRYGVALTEFRRWQGDEYKIVRGSALLTLTTRSTADVTLTERQREEWRAGLRRAGVANVERKQFLPLPIRNGQVQFAISPLVGKLSDGTQAPILTDGNATLLVDLTTQGANEWVTGVKLKSALSGSLTVTYEYPQLLPPVTSSVKLHGHQLFAYLVRLLHLNPDDGSYYGSATEIQNAWQEMVLEQIIEIKYTGPLPAELQGKEAELLATFASQAKEQLFDLLFVASPTPATNSTSSTGGAFYTFRWRRPLDAGDVSMTLRYEAWNWLQGRMDTTLDALFRPLDSTYVNTVYAEVALPVTLAVTGDDYIQTVAASLTFSEGHLPESPVFGRTGGNVQYLVTAARPDQVKIEYGVRVTFTPPNWQPIRVNGTMPLTQGGGAILIKPGSWIRRYQFYLYIQQGEQILPVAQSNPADYLVLNVTCKGPHLASPLRGSVRITPTTVSEFLYPNDPSGRPSEVKVSAVGTVAGIFVQSPEFTLDPAEESIFLLTNRDKVQVVSRSTVQPESNGDLVNRLLHADAHPVVEISRPTRRPHSEGERDAIALEYSVELLPQPTRVSCWAAAMAMVISYRDQMSYSVETIAAYANMDLNTGHGWSSIRQAIQVWGLVEEGPISALPTVWADMLRDWGPIWIVEVGAPYHAVVLVGIYGDGSFEGTDMVIYNPWPPMVGAIEYKPFLDFENEFGLGAGANAMMVHA